MIGNRGRRLAAAAMLAGLVAVAALLSACGSPQPGATVPKVSAALAIDGDPGGYPGPELAVAGAGLRVAHDGKYVYVHVSAATVGWLAVGFNAAGRTMDGANLVLFALGPSGEVMVENHAGNGFTHSRVPVAVEFESVAKSEGGRMIVEFAYPLAFPAGNGFRLSGMSTGDQVTILVSFQRSATSFSVQHSSRGTVTARVE